MKKIVFISFGMAAALFLWGQVDRPELNSVDFSAVDFRNYEGPHQKIDSIAEIRGIGFSLSRRDEGGEGRYFSKYRLLHLVDSQNTGLLDADVLILEAGAGVDHIDNLRRILAAYLEDAYEYSPEEAEVFSRFITYYNAVYRGRKDVISEKYTPLVNQFLTPERIGLSTRYEEWPGKSQILIPLTGRKGDALETDTLTDSEVVESLREKDDRGVDERKEITELKEREIQEEERAIEEDRRALEDREEALKVAREEVVQQEEEVIQQEEEGSITSQEAAEALDDLKEEKEALASEELALEGEERVLEDREERQADRLERIRREREDIANDERELLGEVAVEGRTSPEEAEGVPFLTFSFDTGERLGRLILVDVITGDTLTRSALDNVRSSTFTPFSDGYLLIAGEDGGNRMVSLVLLDRENLQVVKTAEVKVSKDGGVFFHGDAIYTVVEREGRWVPGRFDKNLVLTGILDEEVAEYSFFGFDGGRILYQNGRGQVGSAGLSDFSLP